MSDMKCPICNKPMKQATYDYDKKDDDDTLYMSIMPCDCICNFAASKAVWQELIRTRKELDDISGKHEKLIKHIAIRSNREQELRNKLDIAVDALKSAHKYYQNCVIREKQPHEINWYCTAMNMDNDISEALEQITAPTKGGDNE